MNEAEKYLKEIYKSLDGLPEDEKNKILSEIQNYIQKAVNNNESERVILERLGSPLRLAQAHVNIHKIKNNGIDFKYIMSNLAFYFSTGMSGIIIIPVLSVMAAVFAFCPVAIIAYSLVGLFTDIQYMVNIGTSVFTGIPAVIISVILGLLLFILAVICWRLLKRYLYFISSNYQKMHIYRR